MTPFLSLYCIFLINALRSLLILPEVADLYLTAREQRVISSKQQLDTAYKAEVLSRGLSRVGIIALVDEATGYQYIRDKKEFVSNIDEVLPCCYRHSLAV
jgi:nitrate reductase NapAB chaperone NapD